MTTSKSSEAQKYIDAVKVKDTFREWTKIGLFLIKNISYLNSYLSYRIINSFPSVYKCKTSFNIRLPHFYIRRQLDIIRYMIFQYGLEPVLIQRILIGFEDILK